MSTEETDIAAPKAGAVVERAAHAAETADKRLLDLAEQAVPEQILEAVGRSRRPWSEMNRGERFWAVIARLRSLIGIVLGFGDDIVTQLASTINPKKVEWLWPNRVPLGKLTLFVGDPDNGKSMVATYVAATVTTGRAWFDEKNSVPAGEVLIFASEDDLNDTAVPRLMAAGADRNKVHFATMRGGQTKEEREMQLTSDGEAIKKFLDENANIRLVVIDPVSNYLGHANMNKEQEVRKALTPLQKLVAETSVAIIGIMHLNKKADSQPIHRIGGAMAFVGVARAVWLFFRDLKDADVLHMVPVKKNIGKRISGLKYQIITKPVKIGEEDVPEPYLDWLGYPDQTGDDLLLPKPAGRPRDKRGDALEWLKKILSEGPLPATEIEARCEAEEFSYRTLERIKEEAGVQSVKLDDGSWIWKLAKPPASGAVSKLEGQERQNSQERNIGILAFLLVL
jgi:putative DNA primase/helicase